MPQLPLDHPQALRHAAPPLHRVERAWAPAGADDRPADTETDTVLVLTALQPELGWPRAWAWLPVRERSGPAGDAYERLALPLLLQPFEPPAALEAVPGDALRGCLPAASFPPACDADGLACGLLCLFIYCDLPPQLAREDERPQPGLEAALARLLAQDALSLRHAFVQRPLDTQPGPAGLSLVLAACQYPPGLLDPAQAGKTDLARDPARAGPPEASLARLLALCRGAGATGREVSLLLLAGDQIYADASGGLADAVDRIERYARPYQQFKAGLVRQLPQSLARIVHAPDDHEIVDNWEPRLRADGSLDMGPWHASALAAAWAARWEPGGTRDGGTPDGVPRLWHHFDWQGARFFIADSRFERAPRPLARWRSAQLMGSAQREVFAQWLVDGAPAPRLVLTGSLLLPRRRLSALHPTGALRSDAFCGYPATLHWLLALLWERRASGLVFLSGDEHRSGWLSAEIVPQGWRAGLDDDAQRVRLHSVHSSGLYAPWPSTVTALEDFAAPEVFSFPSLDGRTQLECRVGPWHDHPGDGFALLRVDPDGAALRLWFDRAGRALHAAAELPPADGVLDLSAPT